METWFGRYQLLRKIAAGGMAEIFLARHFGEEGFFRDIAVKRLFPDAAEHEVVLRLFQYEAKLLAELCHPNIPQVIELGHADGAWYIAMEYVEGYNVTDLWRGGARKGLTMPLGVALSIVHQTCEALHHAHERRDHAGRGLGIVHRDVTPHNIMLTRDGVAKLLDFGVAQTAAHPEVDTGTAKGTFSYMAPEQICGAAVDRRADVFAAGIILYELTTGTRLFRGDQVHVLTSIVEVDVTPPTRRIPAYPAELEAIVLRALTRDRDARTPTAAHLADEIESFAMEQRILLGPRTVAGHVREVFPGQRVRESERAIVPRPRLELALAEDGEEDRSVVTRRFERDIPEWLEELEEID